MDSHRHDDVTCGAAVGAGIAHAREAEALIIVDARRDIGLQSLLDRDGAAAVAALAGVLDELALAAAAGAGLLGLHDAEGRTLLTNDKASAAAVRAGLRAGTGGAAAAVALGTLLLTGDGDVLLAAMHRLVKRQGDAHPDVLALAGGVGVRRTARAAKTAEAAAKDVAENIAKVNTVAAKAAETAKAAGAAAVLGSVVGVNTGKAVLVVELALLRVRKHLVCLVDLLELFLGILVAGVIVRVVLHGQLAVSLFDLRVGGRLGYTQHFVVITFLLCHNPITSRISSNLPYIAAHCRFQYRQPQANLYKPDRPANGSPIRGAGERQRD